MEKLSKFDRTLVKKIDEVLWSFKFWKLLELF
jgi:hypothetical protein